MYSPEGAHKSRYANKMYYINGVISVCRKPLLYSAEKTPSIIILILWSTPCTSVFFNRFVTSLKLYIAISQSAAYAKSYFISSKTEYLLHI